ncbi:MAG: hypothetical protein WCH39_07720 [Schlesneria sp.]
MAISSRQAGAVVDCPTCGEKTIVPMEDTFSLETAPPPQMQEESVPADLEFETESGVAAPPLEDQISLDQTLRNTIAPPESQSAWEVDEINDESIEETFVPGDTADDDDDGAPLTI